MHDRHMRNRLLHKPGFVIKSIDGICIAGARKAGKDRGCAVTGVIWRNGGSFVREVESSGVITDRNNPRISVVCLTKIRLLIRQTKAAASTPNIPQMRDLDWVSFTLG